MRTSSRRVTFALALLGALLCGLRGAHAQDAEGLKINILDASLQEAPRLKAAMSLQKKAPDVLMEVILELSAKKDPFHLPLLVGIAVQAETRLLRLAAVHAAHASSPDGCLAAFLERTTATDDKQVMRAIEAVGLLYAPLKTKNPEVVMRLDVLARGQAVLPAIEATRALSRCGDKRVLGLYKELVVGVADDHVRKHTVWGLQDLLGDGRKTEGVLEPLRGRKGEEGPRAKEALEILADAEELPFKWNALSFNAIPDVWGKRLKNDSPLVTIGDPGSKQKVQGWIDELRKHSPLWHQFVATVISRIDFRPSAEDRVYDPVKRIMFLVPNEMAQCESNWQGSYVLVRSAAIGLGALLGEPASGHRGWEPAYVELHAYYLVDGSRPPGTLNEFIEKNLGRKGWK
jgi:hypothetical protein